jgi:hypothetical protein
MRGSRRWNGAALALAVISMISACADDTPATTIDFGDGGSTTIALDPTTSLSGVDSTAAEPGSGSGTGTAGETEDTTATSGGVEALPGQTASQLVSAGGRSTSRSYVLLYSVGQPSQLQSTHESASYRLRGGLVGANGSPP